MTTKKFANIIGEVAAVAANMVSGCKYVELTTYFRNHVPEMTEEEIATASNILYALQRAIRKH
jgi:hypothetical protein